MKSQCLCGRVTLTLEHRPEFINDCNCTLCRKSGAIWGYFTSEAVTISGPLKPVQRPDMDPPSLYVWSCEHCAVTTHWAVTERFQVENPDVDRMGVNMRLFEPDLLIGIELRFPDGKAWQGEFPIPQRRAAIMITSSTQL